MHFINPSVISIFRFFSLFFFCISFSFHNISYILYFFIFMTMPFVVTYSFEAVLKDGLSVFQNSRPNVVKASKLFGLKIYFQTSPFRMTYYHYILFPVFVKYYLVNNEKRGRHPTTTYFLFQASKIQFFYSFTKIFCKLSISFCYFYIKNASRTQQKMMHTLYP